MARTDLLADRLDRLDVIAELAFFVPFQNLGFERFVFLKEPEHLVFGINTTRIDDGFEQFVVSRLWIGVAIVALVRCRRLRPHLHRGDADGRYRR